MSVSLVREYLKNQDIVSSQDLKIIAIVFYFYAINYVFFKMEHTILLGSIFLVEDMRNIGKYDCSLAILTRVYYILDAVMVA